MLYVFTLKKNGSIQKYPNGAEYIQNMLNTSEKRLEIYIGYIKHLIGFNALFWII